MSAKKKQIKAKRNCCKSSPRCVRCPVVLQRLAKQGLAKRDAKGRFTLTKKASKKDVKAARKR